MMTDEQMQERLGFLGEQWRAHNNAPAVVKLDDVTDEVTVTDGPKRGGGWAPRFPRPRVSRWVAAGAGLAAVVAAVAIAVAVRPSGPSAAPMTRPLTGAGAASSSAAFVPSALTGQVWELTYQDLSHAGVPQQALQIGPTGAITVDYRCTQWHGSGRFTALSVTPIGAGTISKGPNLEHRCPSNPSGPSDPEASQTSIDAILSGPILWRVNGLGTSSATLTITKPDTSGRSLTYRLADADSADGAFPAAVAATWRLIDADGIVAHDGQSLDILSTTALSVSYGCGSWLGTAAPAQSTRVGNPSIPNQRVTVTAGSSFQVPCPSSYSSPNATAVRNAIDAILPGTVSWAVNGNTLTITKSGVGTLTYTR
jgi:hypothetical protein